MNIFFPKAQANYDRNICNHVVWMMNTPNVSLPSQQITHDTDFSHRPVITQYIHAWNKQPRLCWYCFQMHFSQRIFSIWINVPVWTGGKSFPQCCSNSLSHEVYMPWLFSQTSIEVIARVSNYIPPFYVDVITYPCLYDKVGLAGQGFHLLSDPENLKVRQKSYCTSILVVCYLNIHYSDVIMGPMASPITSLTLVYSTVYSGADQRKHQTPRHWTGLCAGNSPVTGEFPAQRAIHAESVSIWWRHNVIQVYYMHPIP